MKLLNLSIIITFAIVFSACNTQRYMYSQSAVNVPVLTKKGDSKLAAYYSGTILSSNEVNNSSNESTKTKTYNRGFDVQAAYALTNHIAILANQSNRYEGVSKTNTNKNLSLKYNRSVTEIGAAYFTALNINKKLFLQLSAGGAFGKYKLLDKDYLQPVNNRYYNVYVNKLYVQPALQIFPTSNFAISIAQRFSFLWFKNVNTDYTDTELVDYYLKYLPTSSKLLWEPNFAFNFGLNSLPAWRFELQFGFSVLLSNPYFDYRKSNLSAGLLFDFSKIGMRKNK